MLETDYNQIFANGAEVCRSPLLFLDHVTINPIVWERCWVLDDVNNDLMIGLMIFVNK